MREKANANLGVGVEWTAAAAAQAAVQGADRVGGNDVVHVTCSRHRIDHPAQVFMLDGRDHFSGEVVGRGYKVEFLGGAHAVSVPCPR